MPGRNIEDILREEYFSLLPEIRRVAWQLETEIRYFTLPVLQKLNHYEQLVVRSRVKDCESAIKSLRRRQEGRVFDPLRPTAYSLLSLPDLAGVRVLIFPRARLMEADRLLADRFTAWIPDPVPDEAGITLAPKYSGYCADVSARIRAEYQVVPMLIGLFWEVEHSAMYKPSPSLVGMANSREMKLLKSEVEFALSRFEAVFENFVTENNN
ncbi:MAG TPA: hypothetical protein VGG42_07120 [Acidobacteriaceae bacterium]|jgi:ppGpp synthetase/RelA/SpoT-type nucleotidyltranferase